jgi:polyisoprenoid-binding protein YceI
MRWNIDAGHSAIEFGVKHLGISTTRGRFQKFSGHVETDAAGVPQQLEVRIDAASVDTNLTDRDKHLRSPDFFDVGLHPAITYRSSAVRRAGPNAYEIDGELTLRGVTKPVRFTATVEPAMVDPWGNQRVAGRATGKLNRKDWGLTWNSVLETGGLLVSDEVKFSLEVEVVAERAAVAA